MLLSTHAPYYIHPIAPPKPLQYTVIDAIGLFKLVIYARMPNSESVDNY